MRKIGLAVMVVALAAGGAFWWTQDTGTVPPYPTEAELAALGPMTLPAGWSWNGNVSSGGSPDGKNFGLDVDSASQLWTGDRVQPAEAEVLLAALTKACVSRNFAEALVLVRRRWDDMQDMSDRQLVARVTWDSAPQGTEGRTLQTFEVFYALDGGVCGAVQPKGLIDNPHLERGIRHWIVY